MSETVTPDILSNMGSLDKLLTERGYTTATVPMQGDGENAVVVRNPISAGEADLRDPEVYAAGGVAQQPQQGVTPQAAAPAQPVQPQQPQVSHEQYQAAMAYAARMQAQSEQAAIREQESQDQLFLDSISHLPQVEQDREILIRYNRQLEQRLQGADNQVQTLRETVHEREQRVAKEDVAWSLAMENGLHWENDAVKDLLLRAEDGNQMRQIAAYLSTMTPRQQQQVAQQAAPVQQPQQLTPTQVAAQQMVAAPAQGTATRRAPQVRQHSGDIAGYLKAKPYQLVGQP